MPLTRIFTFERETKNTYRFREDPEIDQESIIGVLYVQKFAFDSKPQKLQVSVEEVK